MVNYMRKAMQAIPLAALVWVVLEKPAFADGICASLQCCGIPFVAIILLIEVTVISVIVRSPMRNLVGMVIWLNLASFGAGLAFEWLHGNYSWFILGAGIVGLCLLSVKRRKYYLPIAELFAFDLSIVLAKLPITALHMMPAEMPQPFTLLNGLGASIYDVILTWILFFLLTVFIESLYARRFITHRRLDLAILAANVASYAVIAIIFYGIPYLNPGSTWL